MTAADLERALEQALEERCPAHGVVSPRLHTCTGDMALARRWGAARALEVLHEAVLRMAGTPDWHKGHTSDTCPLVVEASMREALEREVAGDAT